MSLPDLLATLASARVYDLEQPRYAGAPTFPAHEPGLLMHLHRRHEAGLGERRTSASALLVMAEHSGTHMDALCHQAEDLRLHALFLGMVGDQSRSSASRRSGSLQDGTQA